MTTGFSGKHSANSPSISVTSGRVSGVSAGWIAGHNWMEDMLDQRKSLVNSMKDLVIDSLGNLDEIITADALPDGWQNTLNNVVIDPQALITKGATGVAPVLNLPGVDWPTDFPIMGVLKELPPTDLSYVKPDRPDSLSADFNWAEENYHSVIWEPLYSHVLDAIQNGGPILTQEIQDLILEQGIARQRTIRDVAYQKAMDATSADGFNFPDGVQAGILSHVLAQDVEENSALSRDIAIKMAELADLNHRFSVDKGVALEQIVRNYADSKRNRSLEAEKVLTSFVLQKYIEWWKGYALEYEAIKVELQAKVQVVELAAKEQELTLRKFLGEMEGKKVQADVGKAIIDGYTSGYSSEVDAFRAEVLEKTSWWQALTESQRNQIAVDDLELKKAIAIVDALVKGTLSANELKSKTLNDKTAIVGQILASALTSAHTGLTHGTSESEQLAESSSGQVSVSANHGFEHDPQI